MMIKIDIKFFSVYHQDQEILVFGITGEGWGLNVCIFCLF